MRTVDFYKFYCEKQHNFPLKFNEIIILGNKTAKNDIRITILGKYEIIMIRKINGAKRTILCENMFSLRLNLLLLRLSLTSQSVNV